MRKVADFGDILIVIGWSFDDNGGAKGLPELGYFFCGVGVSGLGGGDETRAVLEKVCTGVFHACFFGAGHGVGANEVSLGAKGGFAIVDDVCLNAADIGDDGVSGEGELREVLGERDYALDGGAENYEVRSLAGVSERSGGGVAPVDVSKGCNCGVASGVNGYGFDDSAFFGGHRDRCPEEAGSYYC